MAKITKLLFSVSEKGNPVAKVWIDDTDTNKSSDAFVLGLPNQVAYLSCLNVGAEIEVYESKGWKNVKVPPFFTDLFDNYKLQKDEKLKLTGKLLNNLFKNCFDSLDFEKNGCVTVISKDELLSGVTKFLDEKFELEEVVLNHMLKSKSTPKLHKNMVKVLEKDDAKQAEIKDAQEILSRYTGCLNREYIAKNNLRVE